MATINARNPFQLYKAANPEASIQDFNGLSVEVSLPYKILASEEALAAALDLVESDADLQRTYAASAVHNAAVYLNQLGCYFPLMSRSQNAKKLAIQTELLLRVVMLYARNNANLLDLVRKLVQESDPTSETVSITDLGNLEHAVSQLEKQLRDEAKASGAKVEMLRRVAVTATTSPSRRSAPPTQDDATEGNEDSSHGTQGRRRGRASASQTEAQAGGGGAEAADGAGPPLKGAKTEEDGAETGAAAAEAAAPSTARARRGVSARAKGPAMLVFGRLRGLTNGEKKAVAALNQIIEVLARVYANKFNDLIPVFDALDERLKAVQAIMDAERAAFEAREDKKPPEPFHETTLEDAFSALATSTQAFRDDDECRYELDEDLLHPIAHACLTVINQIEGYATPPFQEPSEEDRKKKQAAREHAKAKREEAARKVLERAKAKEELAQRREEEKRLLRIRLGGGVDEDDLQEDAEIRNPVPMGYVHYEKTLPLGSTEVFEKALVVWSMLVSVPQPLSLSQMPFTLFVKGLLEVDQDANGLMEEVTSCLLDLAMEHVRISSPATPRIATRGKNWFDALVEFVSVASGNKKKRQQQRRAPSTTTSDDEEEEEEDSDEDSTSDSDSSDSTTPSEEEGEGNASSEEKKSQSGEAARASEEAAAGAGDDTGATSTAAERDDAQAASPKADEEEDTDSFSAELKATVKRVAALRSLATWGNVDLVDRLNLLHFCVLEVLASDKVVEEADKLFKEQEEDRAELEKHVKEIREEAEKEMRGILKNFSAHPATATAGDGTATSTPASSPTSKREKKLDVNGDGYEGKKALILAGADKKRKAAYAKFFSKQDGQDVGAIIQPLGMDRYKRLYWRFPLDRRVLVQTTATTAADFPDVPEPAELRRRRMGGSLFLDDEQEEEEEVALLGSNRRRGARASDAKPKKGADERDADDAAMGAGAAQRTWGVIPGEYIAAFAEGLDPRGEREAPLKKALEEMADYVAGMEEPHDGRATRSRARTFGYLNRLKTYF